MTTDLVIASCVPLTYGIRVQLNATELLIREAYSFSFTVTTILEVDFHEITDKINMTVNVIKPLFHHRVIIGTSTVAGQIITRLPVSSSFSLVVNNTIFEVDTKGKVTLKSTSNLIAVDALSSVVYLKISEQRSSNTVDIGHLDIVIVRLSFDADVPENIERKRVAKIGSENALNASIGGPDAARFSIQDGYLMLMQELDFEDQSQRISNLSVNFTSDSDSFVVCQVNVNTIDENDNDPRFSSSTTTFTVAQSALKTFVTNLKADDIDTTGTLSFSLPSGNAEFEIRNNNELWKLSALNKSSCRSNGSLTLGI